ncbi:hypothetical protein [Mycolicibacterium septicum]|uniref:hypothetical protein n=1 Tax=Mycolicibacterium septicum TaxID=98668 RepID=UPI001AFCBE1D|nr:hypothetical protein [Mycolicibacterium septicum]QRY53387.1 hypothetical protein JVX95_08740 [Mycolicibacterium septicum]
MADNDIGAQLPQPDPRGWLVFDHLPKDLQDAEDARQDADATRARRDHWGVWSRPATVTEQLLLEHLGYELPANLATRVQYLTDGVRRRTWPALES